MTNLDCLDCIAAATHWAHGGYMTQCRGCRVRAVAAAPEGIRAIYLDRIIDPAEREGFERDLAAEVARVATLRMEGRE